MKTLHYRKLILPYTVEDANRKDKPFTSDMEAAALVCLAEGQRKRSRLLGGPSKVSFISKMHYPLWSVPWGERCIILDGLAFLSYKDKYFKPPNVNLFTEDLMKNSVAKEDFLKTLKKHAQTFKDFAGTTEVLLDTLVADKTLLSVLLEYLRHGTPLDDDSEPATVPFDLKIEDATENSEKLIQHWRQVEADIKSLQYALKVLDEGTKLNERGIHCEIEQLDERYTNEISDLKPVVEKKIKDLVKKRDTEVAKITKATEKKLKAAVREKEKYERKLRALERNAVLLRKRIETSERKKKETQVARWSYELKRCRREMDGITTEIKAVSRLIERTKGEKEETLKELEERHRRAVGQEETKISDLMALRDSEIAARQTELEELLSDSSSMKKLVEKLSERKRLHAMKLKEEMAIHWKHDEITLVYLPFYLVRYEKGVELRYRIHSPVFAMDHKGVSMTVQRALRSFRLESRIDLLLRSTSKDLGKVLSSALTKRISENKDFEDKVSGICRSNNILTSAEFKETLTRGLQELRKEGWITPTEIQTVINEYGGIR